MKNSLIYSLIITLAISLITIGYAVKTQELYIDDVHITYREKADSRIINVSENEVSNATYKTLEFSKYNLYSDITLNDSSSYIVYNIEISNLGNVDMGIYDIIDNNDNNNLKYEFLNYNLEDKICNASNVCNNGITKVIELKISYKNYDANKNNYNINLKLDLRPYNTVSLSNFSSKITDEVINGGNYKIDLTNEEVGTIVITDTKNNIITDYVYKDNVLTVNSVEDDIIITNNIPKKINIIYDSYDKVGDSICIESECFNVVNYDSNNGKISLLAKYNLDDSGKQNDDANLFSFYSVLTIKNEKDKDVYGTNSSLFKFVENYVKYFNDEFEILPSGSLLTLSEYNNIIQETDSLDWLYNYNYWLGTAYDEKNIYSIASENKELVYNTYLDELSLRPVLIFNIKDLIKEE